MAHFLRAHQTDIVAEWRKTAWSASASDVNSRDHVKAVSGLIEALIAAAEERTAPHGPGTPQEPASQDINPGQTVSDFTLLRRVIIRRMGVEGLAIGAAESELLWAAFENAVATVLNEYVRSHALLEAARTRRALEIEARHNAAEQRQRFFAESSRALAESLAYQQTLQTFARLAVPDIADWCTLDLLREDGTLERVATGSTFSFALPT